MAFQVSTFALCLSFSPLYLFTLHQIAAPLSSWAPAHTALPLNPPLSSVKGEPPNPASPCPGTSKYCRTRCVLFHWGHMTGSIGRQQNQRHLSPPLLQSLGDWNEDQAEYLLYMCGRGGISPVHPCSWVGGSVSGKCAYKVSPKIQRLLRLKAQAKILVEFFTSRKQQLICCVHLPRIHLLVSLSKWVGICHYLRWRLACFLVFVFYFCFSFAL